MIEPLTVEMTFTVVQAKTAEERANMALRQLGLDPDRYRLDITLQAYTRVRSEDGWSIDRWTAEITAVLDPINSVERAQRAGVPNLLDAVRSVVQEYRNGLPDSVEYPDDEGVWLHELLTRLTALLGVKKQRA